MLCMPRFQFKCRSHAQSCFIILLVWKYLRVILIIWNCENQLQTVWAAFCISAYIIIHRYRYYWWNIVNRVSHYWHSLSPYFPTMADSAPRFRLSVVSIVVLNPSHPNDTTSIFYIPFSTSIKDRTAHVIVILYPYFCPFNRQQILLLHFTSWHTRHCIFQH